MPEDRPQRSAERHQVVLVNRQFAEVTGVINVESFDVREFVLQTTNGMLSIRGDNLHIKTLTLESGVVSIEGVIFDLVYLDDGFHPGEKAKGLFGKLFR